MICYVAEYHRPGCNTYPRDHDERNAALNAYENAHEEESDPFVEMDDNFFGLIDDEAGGYLAAADSLAESSSG